MSGEPLAFEVTARREMTWSARLRRLPWLPLLIIAATVFVGVFAPLLTTHSPYDPSLPDRLRAPSWGGEHVLGTDTMGRDMLTRLFYGARVTLIVAALAILAGGGVGLALGIIAGYSGGRVGAFIMRAVDATLSFPTILIALLLAVTMGPGLKTVIISISLIIWARFARMIRGEVLALKERDFIAHAKVVGCSGLRIMLFHIVPNVMNTFIVLVSLEVGWVIVVEATLSFLGAGIPPPTPSWGQMVAEGREYIASAWWVSLVPGAAITLVVLSLNLFGDWLRDFLDPKLRHL